MKIVKVRVVKKSDDAQDYIDQFDRTFKNFKGASRASYAIRGNTESAYDWGGGDLVLWINNTGVMEIETSEGDYKRIKKGDFAKAKQLVEKYIKEYDL